MSYNVETASLQGRSVTANFFRKIEAGQVKEAAAAADQYIRQEMQGEGIVRRLMPPEPISADRLDRDVETDQPRIIVEKDKLATATFLPFHGANKQQYFDAPRYPIYFGKTESDRFYKSKFELMTYRNDIRQLLADSCVKALTDAEDKLYFNTWDEIVTANALLQKFTLSGGLTAGNIVTGVQKLLNFKIPIGKMAMSKNTFLEALKLDSSNVGDEIVAQHYKNGIGDEESLWGIPCVTTIKNEIIPDNTIWFFGRYAPEENANFLGNFVELQEGTLFLKQEADMIEFYAYGAPGIGIGNTKAAIKVTI
jgi:hypothetical protein